MDEHILSGILKRIEEIKGELETLENEVKELASSTTRPEQEIESSDSASEEPIDLSISVPDIAPSVPDKPEPKVEAIKPEPEAEEMKPEPAKPEADAVKDSQKPEGEPSEKKHRKRKTVMDVEPAKKAVMDVMESKEAWRTDRPGFPVKNIISAISLNDRILLINSLFREDPVLFQDTIAKFNSMASLKEATEYIEANFKDWNLNSEPVYRLMMAVRRKLQ